MTDNVIPILENPEEEIEVPEWVTLDVYRGFTEISSIYDIAVRHNAVICGGYARFCASPLKDPAPAGDVDVFPQDKNTYDNCLKEFQQIGYSIKAENNMSATLLSPTSLPWALMPTVQLIKPVVEGRVVSTGSMGDILSNFDFTVVRVGFLSPTKVMADGYFERDERNHTLRLKNIHCPVSSMLRCMKYARKGYWMRPSEAIRLFMDWNDRGEEYQLHLFNAFKKSEMGKMSQEDIDELEALLRID
jgi:hypothetical protein